MEISFEFESGRYDRHGHAIVLVVLADVPAPHDIWVFERESNKQVQLFELDEEDQAYIQERVREAEMFLDDAADDWAERHFQPANEALVRELNRRNGH